MSRENVNPDFKLGSSDGFMLTDIETDESLMLIPCDTAGNFSWTGATRAPLQRSAMQTTNTNNQYSDIEKPWISIPQDEWTGGRANETFSKDATRYRDGKRAQTSFNSVIYNGPLEYYSEGFRENIYTNYPGSVHWVQLPSGTMSVKVKDGAEIFAGECRVLLRRRGTPKSGLTIGLGDEGSNICSVTITTDDITDTVSEFRRVTFEGETITVTGEDVYLNISTANGDSDDHWEIGCNDDDEPFYRLSPIQEGYRAKFFQLEQLMFMVRQMPNGTPSLWMNGEIHTMEDGEIRHNSIELQTFHNPPYVVGDIYPAGSVVVTSRNTEYTIPEWYYGVVRQSTLPIVNNLYLEMHELNGRISDTVLRDNTKSWTVDQWKGARIGIVYGKGVHGQCSVWRNIVSNTVDTITVDEPWDVPFGDEFTYIIVNTPLWTDITPELLVSAVTDIEVIHGTAYICQGDYTPYMVMRYDQMKGEFVFTKDTFSTQIMDTTGETDKEEIQHSEELCATFIKSVRDTDGIMLWRARNDAISYEITEAENIPTYGQAETSEEENVWEVHQGPIHNRVIDKSYLIDRDVLVKSGSNPSAKWTLDSALTPAKGKVIPDCTYPDIYADTNRTGSYADFFYPDVDFKQYQIAVGKFTSTENTGVLTVTLQESPDIYDWKDVTSITCTCEGVFYLHAHCQHRFRRFILTVSGTNANVRSIIITMGTSPVFTNAVVLRDNYGKITKLFEYGAEQTKNLWVFQEGMVSSVNKHENSDSYTLDRMNLDEIATTADEWNGSSVSSADVYLAFGWLNGMQRYYNTQLEGKGPDHDEGLPFDRQGRVTQIINYPTNIFICIDGGDDGYSTVMQFNQTGWCELYRAPNVGERIFDMSFQPIYGDRPDRLWVQVGDDIIWLTMPSKILYALQDRNAEYTHESVLISSWHTAGMADIEKLWHSLKIMADYLDGENCWIEVDYQIDEEDTWHPVKEFYTVSPSQKEELDPTRSTTGKKFRYRLRLQTSDIHKTPKVNVVVLEAVGRVDIKQSYNFYFRNIKYKRDLTAEFEDLEPVEVQNVLDRWANELRKLRLNSRWLIYDDKICYLDATQVSIVNELSEGYIAQITLNEL